MMNLSTSAYFERATHQMGQLRARANDLQAQMNSQQRLTKSSDDPVAAARLRTLSRKQTLSDIDKANADRAMSDLKLTDGALSSVADVITRATELATQAGNGTYNASQRASIGAEIEGLQNILFLIVNGQNSAGHALFGGQTGGAAYTQAGNSYSYAGTPAALPLDLGEGQQVVPGMTGPEVLSFDVNGTQTDLFAVLGSLASALQDPAADGVSAANATLTSLDAGLEKVTTAQTVIGSRMNWVELMDDRRVKEHQLTADEQTEIGGADLAETLARMQEVMTVLEASQASFVKLANLSLFNVI